mmetsp:Transcript_10073/g.17320  ORF Transcript_10073/g.17320 Transcript_10073/m.17320 type:complete len:325 (-) Transcript_10073:1052-2026(-)
MPFGQRLGGHSICYRRSSCKGEMLKHGCLRLLDRELHLPRGVHWDGMREVRMQPPPVQRPRRVLHDAAGRTQLRRLPPEPHVRVQRPVGRQADLRLRVRPGVGGQQLRPARVRAQQRPPHAGRPGRGGHAVVRRRGGHLPPQVQGAGDRPDRPRCQRGRRGRRPHCQPADLRGRGPVGRRRPRPGELHRRHHRLLLGRHHHRHRVRGDARRPAPAVAPRALLACRPRLVPDHPNPHLHLRARVRGGGAADVRPAHHGPGGLERRRRGPGGRPGRPAQPRRRPGPGPVRHHRGRGLPALREQRERDDPRRAERDLWQRAGVPGAR